MSAVHRRCLLSFSTIILLAGASAARANPHVAVERPPVHTRDAPESVGTENLPEKCRVFASVPVDAHGTLLEWEQALSLAACVQDGWLAMVSDLEKLPALVEQMSQDVAPSMMIYLAVLESGPVLTKLRAAYQIALTSTALVTRARASVVGPPALHEALEPLLAPSKHTAWVAFATIDRTAAAQPALLSDPATRDLTRTAHAMLALIPDWKPETPEAAEAPEPDTLRQ